jgi:hypothetical protein
MKYGLANYLIPSYIYKDHSELTDVILILFQNLTRNSCSNTFFRIQLQLIGKLSYELKLTKKLKL